MARIAGVNIPTGKRVEIALTYIFGIGRTKARQICATVGVPSDRRVNQLTEDETIRIREAIDSTYQVEGDLRREVSMNIKRLMDLGCYRGLRHRRGLPVHCHFVGSGQEQMPVPARGRPAPSPARKRHLKVKDREDQSWPRQPPNGHGGANARTLFPASPT